jgi:hypothetical protein
MTADKKPDLDQLDAIVRRRDEDSLSTAWMTTGECRYLIAQAREAERLRGELEKAKAELYRSHRAHKSDKESRDMYADERDTVLAKLERVREWRERDDDDRRPGDLDAILDSEPQAILGQEYKTHGHVSLDRIKRLCGYPDDALVLGVNGDFNQVEIVELMVLHNGDSEPVESDPRLRRRMSRPCLTRG